MDNHPLSNQIILITGASRGIGYTVARAFAKAGATLILIGRNVKALSALYDDILADGAPKPALYPMNFIGCEPQHYQDLAHHIEKTYGRLDGLLHNAAAPYALTPIEHTSAKKWHEIIQTNLNAPMMLTQALLPVLKKSKHGRIVFTLGNPQHYNHAYYGANGVSKAALSALTQMLADELANTSITVAGINPVAFLSMTHQSLYPGGGPLPLKSAETLSDAYCQIMNPEVKLAQGEVVEVD